MVATKKLQVALGEIDRTVYSGGRYSLNVAYGLDGLAKRMAEYIGFETRSHGGEYDTFTARHAKRIVKLVKKYDLDWPKDLLAAVEAAEEKASWYKFENSATGEVLYIDGDFAQASSPIFAKYEDGEWFGTPYQVADARHSPLSACKLVARWGG